MKQFLLIGLLVGLSLKRLYAQETIYLANGNRSAGKLAGAEGEKVKISVVLNGKPASYNLRRENVLLAIANDGRFLIISTLNPDPAKAQQEIDAFQNGTSPRPPYDLLLKETPATVIPGYISYESDEVVNYKALNGGAASVNKRELAAIFYHDGRHRLLQPPASVVTAINSTRTELLRLSVPPPPAVATTVKKPERPAPAGKNNAKRVVARTGQPIKSAPVKSEPVPEPVSPPGTPAEAPVGPPSTPKPTLSDAQYQQYRASALHKVDEFVAYMNIVANKELGDEEKDKAIEEVVKLFMPDATIEVSSANRPGARKFKIKDYFTRLKMLPYSSTAIEWTEIQYVSELKQAADGDYYGLITGQQTFTGYADNGKDVLYTDVTEKSVKVKLQSYRKMVDGQTKLNWEVLLGNIGVVVK